MYYASYRNCNGLITRLFWSATLSKVTGRFKDIMDMLHMYATSVIQQPHRKQAATPIPLL